MKIKVLILILPSFFKFFNCSFCHSYITRMDTFHQSFRNYLIWDYEILTIFFSLKVLQPLMATAGGMWALLTSCYILLVPDLPPTFMHIFCFLYIFDVFNNTITIQLVGEWGGPRAKVMQSLVHITFMVFLSTWFKPSVYLSEESDSIHCHIKAFFFKLICYFFQDCDNVACCFHHAVLNTSEFRVFCLCMLT